MPLHSAIAAALTTGGARYATLTIGGLDVLLEPGGTPGQRFGVPIETIQATERGPGGVSSLEFELWDPAAAVTLVRNQPVRYEKTAEAIPVFQGFVTSWAVEPLGTAGRRYEVRCSGLEIVLDWAKVPAMSLAAGTTGHVAVQMLAANTVNGLAFPLKTGNAGSGSSYDFPVGGMDSGVIGSTTLTISAGSTLREAIRAVSDDLAQPSGIAFGPPRASFVTVDSTGGLRVYQTSRNAADPDIDAPIGFLATLYVTDSPSSPADGTGSIGSPMVSETLDFEVDATFPAAVLVVGSGVSALVRDSTGEDGDTAVISDTTLTTEAQCRSAALGYLALQQSQRRASFDLPNKVPQPTFRAGSVVQFTDLLIGENAGRYFVTELERRFHGTLEDWTVTVGGAGRPSHVVEMRRLTRNILS